MLLEYLLFPSFNLKDQGAQGFEGRNYLTLAIMIKRIYSSIQLILVITKTLKAVVFPRPDQPFWSWTQLSVKELPDVEVETEEQRSMEMSVSQTTAN